MRRAMSPLRAGGRIRGAHMPLAALVLAAALAPDQAAAETASDGAHSLLEEIIVTGSRIRRDALTARDWVLHVDGDDRDRSGLSSLGDLLARLPVSGSPLSTRFNSSGNFGFPADGGGVAAGASQVDLRHLGSKRVLVLVDGLRWVNGSSGSGVSGATDLNTIPASVVERVEVLRDGASAIYGSDAVAGVVNVITRKVRGVTARAHRGGFENGGETTDLELALGGAWGATSASAHIAHTDQARVRAADHEQTRWPKPGTGVLHGSTFTPQGRVVFADPNTGRFVNCALNDGVTGVPVYDPADPCGPGDDYHPWSNADRFNYATYNLVLTPSTRTGVFGRVEHETAHGTRLQLRAFFNRRESVNQAAPEPVWAGTLGETGSLMADIVIDADNPYNPCGC
ncbi:MAG: TonB-dependent receptor plug domain-containing protein, partial [Gammaproteobacteria bacterium]|nr:TonB-dependent receptor plug domain-containing protein [Gammaproteobacteria bacterium]